MGFATWIDGRRTYAVAAGSRLAIAYLWSNGLIGHEAAAGVFALALGGSAARAGGKKIEAAVERLAKALGKAAPLILITGVLVVAGCATLGGGSAEAKAAEAAAVLGLAPLIPPPFNLLLPAAWGLVEALGVIFAKPAAPKV